MTEEVCSRSSPSSRAPRHGKKLRPYYRYREWSRFPVTATGRAYSLCAWPGVTSGSPVTVTGNEPLLPLPKNNYAQPWSKSKGGASSVVQGLDRDFWGRRSTATCERERVSEGERARESMCLKCVCVRERKCVCVIDRERVCVCARER